MTVERHIGVAKLRHLASNYDTLFFRLHLPPIDAPAPIIILLPASGATAAAYEWLAARLTAHSFAVLTYDWALEEQGRVGYAPGVELSALDPAMDATIPSAPALPAILGELERLNEQSLGGRLDMARLILGGHGAGGWLALHNATRRFFLTITAAFAFCPNPLAMLAQAGHEAGSLPVLPSEVPTLMIAASEDGVGSALNARCGEAGERGAPFLRRLWERSAGGGHGHAYFMTLKGANFTTFTHPLDLLDPDPQPETADGAARRKLAADIAVTFARACISRTEADLGALRAFIAKPPPLLGEACLK